MALKWCKENLNIIDREEGETIDWGNGVYTQLDIFLSYFDETITQAISQKRDVRKMIADNDRGRGYKKLITLTH